MGRTKKKRWRFHTQGNTLHVWPTHDLIEHDTPADEDGDCVCGPRPEPVERDDGSIGWIIRHSSLDGREQHEQ